MSGVPSDAVLMDRCRRGDHDAFAQLAARHTPLVLRVARRVAGDAAEDVVQQTLLSAWLGCERYDAARGSVPGWLCGIARNRAIDTLRAERRRGGQLSLPEAEDALACATEGPEDIVQRRMRAATVRRALSSLGEEQRIVLVLSYFGELSHAEIQEATHAPLGTVKSRMRLGLNAMRAQLPRAA